MRRAKAVVAFALLLLCCSRAARQQPNLLANGGFEQQLAGWELIRPLPQGTEVRIEGATRAFGKACLYIVSTNKGEFKPVGVRQGVSVTGGREYELSLFCKNSELASSAGVFVEIFDAAGKRLSGQWAVVIPTWRGSWREQKRTLRLPKSAVRVVLSLALNGPGEVWFDEVSLAALQRRPEKVAQRLSLALKLSRKPCAQPLFCLLAGDPDRDGQDELLLGRLDNLVVLQDKGQPRLKLDVGGLPVSLALGDVAGDEEEEIAVASMDVAENVYLFDLAGRLLWKRPFDDNRCARVAIGDLNGDGKGEVVVGSGNTVYALSGAGKELWQANFGGPRVAGLAVGDINGDEKAEVVVGFEAQGLFLAALDSAGHRLWAFRPPDIAGSLTVSTVNIADLDGDQAPEIVAGASGGRAFVLRGDGSEKWRFTPRERARDIALAAASDVLPEVRGREVILCGRRSLRVLRSDGAELFSCASRLPIMDFSPSPTAPALLYLGSGGFHDGAYYELALLRGKENDLESFARDDPCVREAERVYQAVQAMAPLALPEAVRPGRKFRIILFVSPPTRERILRVWQFVRERQSAELEFVLMFWMKELPVELHRSAPISQEQIVNVARICEENEIPFLFFCDHGARPWITLETARKTVEAAPRYCRGFYLAENVYEYPSDVFWQWMDWVDGLLELCAAHGKKVVFKEMYDCWAFLVADRRVAERWFKPQYRSVIVPMLASNNAHAPELTIGGMVGLWLAGAVDDWGMSSQHWNVNWQIVTKVEHESVCPPDIIFRMDLAAAALGCSYFHIEGGQKFLTRQVTLDPEAKLHRELLQELMRKRALLPPAPEQVVGLSPLAIVYDRPSPPAGAGKVGSPAGRVGTPLREGFLGVRCCVQTVPRYYFGAYAYGLTRFCQGLFPQTPFGLVPIVPALCAQGLGGGRTLVVTDGNRVRLGGRWLAPDEARGEVERLLAQRAAELPLRAEGAFLSAQRWGGEYRAVLIDPGYLNPRGARAKLFGPALSGGAVVRDVLSGERLAVRGGAVELVVPPGGFRILSVKR